MPRLFSILTIISIITTRATAPMPIPIMRKGKDEPFVSVGCRSGMVVGVGGTAVVAVAGAEVGVVNVGVSVDGFADAAFAAGRSDGQCQGVVPGGVIGVVDAHSVGGCAITEVPGICQGIAAIGWVEGCFCVE